MNIIVPIPITDSMILAGTTIAEPAAGETAWSPSTISYVIGDERIRATTHRIYRCAANHTSAASPTPENDPTRWVDIGPTSRYAPFDFYTSTAALTTTSLTYVLQPGFVNAIAMYGLTGANYTLTIKDAPGGTVLFTQSGSLTMPPLGWYDYFFGRRGTVDKLLFKNLPIRPTAEITITITSASGQPVGVGMIVCGDYVSLAGVSGIGGTEFGAESKPTTFSYRRFLDDGTVLIRERGSSTDLRLTVIIPHEDSAAVSQQIKQVLNKPIAWIGSDAAGYEELQSFGLGSGSMRYENYGFDRLTIEVTGIV
jgi:hypothetical protein